MKSKHSSRVTLGMTENSEKIKKSVENTHAYATLHWKTSLKGHMKYTTWAD